MKYAQNGLFDYWGGATTYKPKTWTPGAGTYYGFDFDSSKYKTLATKYTYTPQDSTKIRAKIKEKQKKLNKQGVPIKINYGALSCARSMSGATILSVDTITHIDKARKFLDTLKLIDRVKIDHRDEMLLQARLKEKKIKRKNGTKITSKDIDALLQNIIQEAPKNKQSQKERYIKYIESINDDREKGAQKGNGRGGVGEYDLREVKEKDINTTYLKIKNKIRIPLDHKIKTTSFVSGKRINRGYVLGVEKKPLVHTNTRKIKKKKILQIIDGSGSMSTNDNGYRASQVAYALERIEAIQTTIYHTYDGGINRGEGNKYALTGSEGFVQLEGRLAYVGESLNDYDYIFCYSDLHVGSQEMNALKALLSPYKNHSILTFSNQYTVEDHKRAYPDLNFLRINNTQTIIDSVLSAIK